jgi:glutathione S-transferase
VIGSSGMSLVLYVEPQWVSPYVFACYVTLREKGLDFEARALNAARGDTRTPEYIDQTITGRVPTLVHEGFGLGESTAIVEYLEETFPEPPVLPAAPRDRARCRQLMSWIRSDETAALRTERSTHTMFFEPTKTPLSAEAERQAKKLVDVAGRVIRPGQPYIFETWSIIDAELAFILHRLIANADPVPSGVKSWAASQWERESVRSFVDIVRPKLSA